MGNFLDKAISFIDPKAGLNREIMRAKLSVLQASQRGYDGATKGRRGEGWTRYGTSENANSDIQASLTDLRKRSVDGYKNNPNVFKATRTIQNNVIGTGVMATPKSAPGQKKLTDNEIRAIKELWSAWAETAECDFDGFFTFYGLQSMAMRNISMQGEIFVMKERDTTCKIVPFRLRILAPHMVDHTKSSLTIVERAGNYVVQGVEFDSRGRRVGFWIYDSNPNNEYTMKLAPKFVPMSDLLQVFYKEYPEQVRGIPFGTSAMLAMRDLADYKDAQLMLQKIAACHVAFTTKPLDAGAFNNVAADGSTTERLEPGLIEHMAPGETVTFNNPPTPSSFSEYVSKMDQSNAAAFGVTYEQYTGDMSNVNFSSGRMGWIESQGNIRDIQSNVITAQFCNPIWNWFIEGLQIMGKISKSVAAEWTPQGREMIDPVKEMNGLILELKSGLVSWTEACKRRGYNPDMLFEQIKADKKLFGDAGIDVEWIIENVDPAEELSPNQAKADKNIDK